MISTQNIQSVYPMEILSASDSSHISPPSVMGQVIRVRPHVYLFVCELCRVEHRSIDSFLSHSEAHFQAVSPQNGMQNGTQNHPVTTQVHSVRMLSDQMYAASTLNGPLNQSSVDSEQMTQSLDETIDITASPNHSDDGYIEEVFEITDLGYDFTGIRYPTAQTLAELASTPNGTDDNAKNGTTKKRQNDKKTYGCSLCPRKYAQSSSLNRHKASSHADILAKLTQLKKAYKCLVCNKKFPKSTHSKLEAEGHMKMHVKKGAKK